MLLNNKMKNMDAKVRDFTVSSMLAFGVICNYLYLGKTEFDNHETLYDFNKKLTTTPQARRNDDSVNGATVAKTSSSEQNVTTEGISLKDMVHLFYTDNDFWAPLHVETKAKSIFGMKTTVKKGIPHAFGVATESSEIVAEWTSEYLRNVVKSGAMDKKERK